MNQPLAEAVFWIAAIACAVAEIAILRSTFTTLRAYESTMAPGSRRGAEIAWAVIPAIGLVVVLTATWQKVEARERQIPMMDQSQMHHAMPMPQSSAER
jgi:heme/copper-type cytochrome/quinol oxidase subunit 2